MKDGFTRPMSSTATAVQGRPGTGYGGIVLPTRDEIAATIAPYVVERHPEDSAAWKTIAGPVQRYFWKKYHITRLLKGKSRSEEHTSELQSLMRISYAVFCLQKKK